MNKRNGNHIAVLVTDILILMVAVFLALMIWIYAAASWRSYAFWALCVLILVWLIREVPVAFRLARATGAVASREEVSQTPSMLALLSEERTGVRSWDLRNKTGLVIGRSREDADVDVDLSDTEYFALISDQHAVLNFTAEGWLLSDAGSKNGTALLRAGADRKLLLAPGEPAPIRPGDRIYIAQETVLLVK